MKLSRESLIETMEDGRPLCYEDGRKYEQQHPPLLFLCPMQLLPSSYRSGLPSSLVFLARLPEPANIPDPNRQMFGVEILHQGHGILP